MDASHQGAGTGSSSRLWPVPGQGGLTSTLNRQTSLDDVLTVIYIPQGPLVHVSCCAASLFLSLIGPKSRDGSPDRSQNESQRRKTLAAAATAGVAVAFGSPLGGVLFGLEELDSTLFSNEQLMWRAFVTSAVAATTLSYVDPFGIGKLVLFQVSAVSWGRGPTLTGMVTR